MRSVLKWFLICFSQVLILRAVGSAAVNFICKNPMDIRDVHGVRTNKIPGSRVEYNPFPGGFRIVPGRTLHIDFRTDAEAGMIFLVGNLERSDMVSVYLRRGHLMFARRCGNGRASEIFRDRLDDNKWHSLTYQHSEKGGKLLVDNFNAFRQYHLGPCADFNSVFFGGLGLIPTGKQLKVARHRFDGCLRNMRIDGRVPTIQPHYYAVSQCE